MNDFERHVLKYAEDKCRFSSSELAEHLTGTMELSRPVLNTYLARMVKAGKLCRVGRGTFSVINAGSVFMPEISERSRELYLWLQERFPFAKLCVSEGSWFSSFMHHVAVNNAIYVEAERDARESVFESLRSSGRNAFLKPDENTFYRYVNLDSDTIIVKTLVSKSPTMEKDGIVIPTLEKILVDMYCDKDFVYLQGSEYYSIMNHAISHYAVNQTTLLQYASRRNSSVQLKKIMEECEDDID